MHVTADLLWAFYQRQLDNDTFVQLLAHPIDECAECLSAVEAFAERCRGLDYTDVIRGAQRRLLHQHGEIRREQDLAQQWRQHLDQVPLEEQLTLAASHQDGTFRGTAFAHVMLQSAREALPGQPRLAWYRARLAEQALDPCCDDPELIALTLAHQGNARRALGDLQAAEALFQRVRQLSWRPTDLTAAAEISGFLGSLRRDQRRFDEAIHYLRRSIRLFRVLGNPMAAVAHMLVLGYTHYFLDDCENAIGITTRALESIDPEQHERLYLCARHNLTLYRCGAGQYQQAERDLLEDMPLYRRHLDNWPRLTLVVDWLAGRIALGLDRRQQAEELLHAAHRQCEQEGVSYDAAMVCLDLALLYSMDGRLDELQALTAQIVPLLRSFELHREARAALNLFETSVRQQVLTAAVLGNLNLQLLQARARCISNASKPS